MLRSTNRCLRLASRTATTTDSRTAATTRSAVAAIAPRFVPPSPLFDVQQSNAFFSSRAIFEARSGDSYWNPRRHRWCVSGSSRAPASSSLSSLLPGQKSTILVNDSDGIMIGSKPLLPSIATPSYHHPSAPVILGWVDVDAQNPSDLITEDDLDRKIRTSSRLQQLPEEEMMTTAAATTAAAIASEPVLEMMNRNARRGKRANRGKRAVSRYRRREKKRAIGRHRR